MFEDSLAADQEYEGTIGSDGSLNFPMDLLERAGLKPGDLVRMVVEDGEVKLLPMRYVVSQMAVEISQIMAEEGVTLDDLLAGLEETGGDIFRETYGDVSSDASST